MTGGQNPSERQRRRAHRERTSLIGALRRYGFCKAFLSKYTVGCFLIALAIPVITPWGQGRLLEPLLSMHVTLLGFNLAVFSFIIVGGRDEFFDSVLNQKGRSGYQNLEELNLKIAWPIFLHMACIVLLLSRFVLAAYFRDNGLNIAGGVWRVLYVFFASWSMVQTWMSANAIFRLSLIRLRWNSAKSQARHVQRSDPRPSVVGQDNEGGAIDPNSPHADLHEGSAPPP